MNDSELKDRIKNKLGIKRSALYLKASKIRDKLNISPREAFYVLAFSAGIRLDKMLSREEVDRIRDLNDKYLSSKITQSTDNKGIGHVKRNPATKIERQIIINISELEKITDPLLAEEKIRNSFAMAKVYIRIFVLENSFRETIDLVMTKHYGKNWWDLKVKKTLKDTYNDRKKKEDKNPWFGQKRGARPIDYLDLSELPNIVENNVNDFIPDIFPNLYWLKEKIDELYFSRCVICHMNSLVKHNIDDVNSIFRKWENQIKERKDLIKQ